ncbi:unnamed protein product, partial [marine sediment metagenome]
MANAGFQVHTAEGVEAGEAFSIYMGDDNPNLVH